jgi:hypothetical protein
MTMRLLGAFLMVAALVSAASTLDAQTAAKKPATRGTSGRTVSVSATRALSMTCLQAWTAAGKNYAPMLDIVKTLAKMSLTNRNLTFPNSREAGIDAGSGIADDCKADPNALLFAIVDKHFRRVAESARR